MDNADRPALYTVCSGIDLCLRAVTFRDNIVRSELSCPLVLYLLVRCLVDGAAARHMHWALSGSCLVAVQVIPERKAEGQGAAFMGSAHVYDFSGAWPPQQRKPPVLELNRRK
jgi:hypothetical protein